jgi:hypothetical protein
MKYVKIPYWLVMKYYWKRLLAVSTIWFLYDVRMLLNALASCLSNRRKVLHIFFWYIFVHYPQQRYVC